MSRKHKRRHPLSLANGQYPQQKRNPEAQAERDYQREQTGPQDPKAQQTSPSEKTPQGSTFEKNPPMQEKAPQGKDPLGEAAMEQKSPRTARNAIVQDSSGNVYTTGEVTGPAHNQDPLPKVENNNVVLQPNDKRVLASELTTGQTGILYGLPQAPVVMVTDPTVTNLYRKYTTPYDTYRRIRKDPTIALCRAVIAGPLLSSTWTVETATGVHPGIKRFIEAQFLKRRFRIEETAIYGCIDFGWQGYEKVFETVDFNMADDEIEDPPRMEKLIGLRKLKPLLQDMTAIKVYLYNGDFAGFQQGIVFIEAPKKAVLLNFRVEGTMWHGNPLLEDAKASVDRWDVIEEGAGRYDKKIAGSHFVVYYPPGKSKINGVEVDNSQVASAIVAALEASGNITVPSQLLSFVEGVENSAENQAWKIEFISDNGARQASFVERLRYEDSCKCRAMHIPERAILEGQFGTKAEAEGHGDVLTVLLENIDYRITEQINTQCVDHLLQLNWGKDMIGKVWLKSAPLSDDKIAYVRQVLGSLMGQQAGFTEIFPALDYDSLIDLCDLPKVPKDEREAQEPPQQPGLNPSQLGLISQMGLKPGAPQPFGNRFGNAMKGNGKFVPGQNPFEKKPNPFEQQQDNPEDEEEEQVPPKFVNRFTMKR